jgi:hypothetical protein
LPCVDVDLPGDDDSEWPGDDADLPGDDDPE